MKMKNTDLPTTPKIWVDGKRVAFRPQCNKCGVVAEKPRPLGWIYNNGFICPDCKIKEN